MNTVATILLAIAFVALKEVESFSTGAPSSACENLTPNPTNHLAQPQQSAVPYGIDLAPLAAGYTPGQAYTRKRCAHYMYIARLSVQLCDQRLISRPMRPLPKGLGTRLSHFLFTESCWQLKFVPAIAYTLYFISLWL